MTATHGSTSAMLWQHFASKAEAIGAGVQFAETETAAADVILRGANTAAYTATVAMRFPDLTRRFEGRVGSGELTASDVVAAVPLAVAETGSVVLAETDADRGCILHLRGAADAAHAPFEVRHFVEPLADRLRQLVQVRREG